MILEWPQITMLIWSILSVGVSMGAIPDKPLSESNRKSVRCICVMCRYAFLNFLLYFGGFYTS